MNSPLTAEISIHYIVDFNDNSHGLNGKGASLNALISFTLLVALLGMLLPEPAHAKTWSAKKLQKSILSMDKELRRKRWENLIKRGQQALPHCIARYTERDQRCITILRNINMGFERTRRFNDDPSQIEKAYTLAKSELGPKHFTTVMSRELYYKYLLVEERYVDAVPVVLEIIEVEESIENDQFEILERVMQLYALYGLSEQFEQEEQALLRLLELTEKLIGKESEDYNAAALALAENYCVQKKYHEFFSLVKKEKLEFHCSLDNR